MIGGFNTISPYLKGIGFKSTPLVAVYPTGYLQHKGRTVAYFLGRRSSLIAVSSKRPQEPACRTDNIPYSPMPAGGRSDGFGEAVPLLTIDVPKDFTAGGTVLGGPFENTG